MVAWAPLRDEWLRAESMSRLVRGIGQDNHLQMRLSAYVLATRLDQVVAAANERLGHMRDQRYLLQRTERAARKGSQAGLGLEVVDQWTGDARDPATLSGGETFVVSLSLALGLADVVTQEAGGTEIETLFVDEGFGTLDADTLDDVMDRLDGLRAGGRTVGVVSHVSELRNRIPTQVHVQKGRTGSTVTVATLVGMSVADLPMVAVVDIDGVVADVRHRLHHVTGRPKDWRSFFAAAADDGLLGRGRAHASGRWPRSTTSSTSPGGPSGCAGSPRTGSPATTCPAGELHAPSATTTTGRRASTRSTPCARSPRPAPSWCSSTTTRGCCDAARAAGFDVLPATWMGEHTALREAQERDGRT